MASIAWLTVTVAITFVLVEVNAIPQCLKFRWVGQENSPLQGIRIAGTESYSEQIGYMDNKTNADDCFYDCCVRAVESESCNAASFYKDSEGHNHCFLLFCNPFTDCQWTLSYDREHKSAFMTVIKESAGQNIQQVAEQIEDSLQWNILHEDTTTTSSTSTPSTTTAPPPSTTESLTESMDSQVVVTNAPASLTTEEATTTTATTQAPTHPPTTTQEQKHETESIGVTPAPTEGQVDWPAATGTADEGMGDSLDTGDTVAAVGGEDESGQKSFGTDNESDGVNKTAIIVCSLGGVTLLIAGIVIAIKRYQVEKDRSVYRPLMDDIHNRGFKESDPLH